MNNIQMLFCAGLLSVVWLFTGAYTNRTVAEEECQRNCMGQGSFGCPGGWDVCDIIICVDGYKICFDEGL